MFNEYDPNGQNGTPSYHQGGNPTPHREDRDGSTAQLLGILALVLHFVFGALVSITLGAIAIHYANRSRNALRFETQEAKTGRVCGLIGLILGILSVLAIIACIAFFWVAFLTGMLGAV